MRVSTTNAEQLLSFLGVGIYSSPEIQRRFDISQATVSRLLTQLKGKIVTIGRARSCRYSKLRNVRGLGGEFPVYQIDPDGNAHVVGALFAIANDQFLWRPVESHEQIFKSLPWFLADLRPEGFVGRAFVRQLHHDLWLPPRSSDWNEDHVLTALARRGEDTMGNIVVGQESIDRYFAMTHDAEAPIPEHAIANRYITFAQNARDGQPVGSSAGGEQPKFTAMVERKGDVQNVVVKFSPPLSTVEGRRWGDLLICEHHALQILQQAGISSATSCVVEAGDQVFLEVVRFDRTGLFGRLPMISLRAVDNQFYGYQDNWINAANRMAGDGRLSTQDASSLRCLSAFGHLIGNNDQHFGNISLVMIDGSDKFLLAPAYDMLPMFYRPMDGRVPSSIVTFPVTGAVTSGEWTSAFDCASLFWERVKSDPRISEGFRTICTQNQQALMNVTTRPRLINTRVAL